MTKNSWLEAIRFAVITLLIVIPIRTFIAQPFLVSGASMDPTFHDGQYLIIDQLSYYLRQPERGEVAIFRYPKDERKFFIKRVIGLPGETVTINGATVTITTAGGEVITLNEPYLNTEHLNGFNLTRQLAQGEFFVMGDNRGESLDSRIWGPVPLKLMQGRVIARLLPLAQAAILPGDSSQQK